MCLVGCPNLEIDLRQRFCRIGGKTMREGEFLSLDGNHGGIYAGKLEVVTERPERELAKIEGWHASTVLDCRRMAALQAGQGDFG